MRGAWIGLGKRGCVDRVGEEGVRRQGWGRGGAWIGLGMRGAWIGLGKRGCVDRVGEEGVRRQSWG